MKIRTGFVSNSSSSSFCVYGIDIYQSDFFNMVKDFSCVKDSGAEFSDADEFFDRLHEGEIDIFDIESELSKKSSKVLSLFFDAETYESFCIGAEFDQWKDDETAKEFRERISNLVKSFVNVGRECEIIVDTAYS